MTIGEIIYYILVAVLSIATYLPLIDDKHWFFRFFDFTRRQTLFLLILLFLVQFLVTISRSSLIFVVVNALLLIAIFSQLYYLAPYFIIFGKKKKTNQAVNNPIQLMSVNVFMKNSNYQPLIELVKKHKPHIFLTVENDKKWNEALTEIEQIYPNHKKIPLDNTYGMNLYTLLEVRSIDVHYFVSGKRPSIEACLKTEAGQEFTFWGIHPPPPSPTEKTTSESRDNELMEIAENLCNCEEPVVVAGDFNTVCWSKIARKFAKQTKLIDARKRRGFWATFPAKCPVLCGLPIDLLYHSENVNLTKLKTLKNIDSDHLPLYAEFVISG